LSQDARTWRIVLDEVPDGAGIVPEPVVVRGEQLDSRAVRRLDEPARRLRRHRERTLAEDVGPEPQRLEHRLLVREVRETDDRHVELGPFREAGEVFRHVRNFEPLGDRARLPLLDVGEPDHLDGPQPLQDREVDDLGRAARSEHRHPDAPRHRPHSAHSSQATPAARFQFVAPVTKV
jgi:hypothetical protein